MGKSKKLAIYKDIGFAKKTYHKIVRTNVNQKLRQIKDIEDAEELELPEPETIVNDYDYSDYTCDLEHDNTPYWDNERKEMRRK